MTDATVDGNERPGDPDGMATPDGDDLLTIAEAAELLKVSAVTVSRWRRQGRLPTLKVGPRAVRIRRADLGLVARPYGGPDRTPGDDAQRAGWPATLGTPALTASPAPGQPGGAPAERTLARATLLRTAILKRRHGDYLEPAGDDLGKLRDKRAKRRQ